MITPSERSRKSGCAGAGATRERAASAEDSAAETAASGPPWKVATRLIGFLGRKPASPAPPSGENAEAPAEPLAMALRAGTQAADHQILGRFVSFCFVLF